MTLENIFNNLKQTENGDIAYSKVSNNRLLDILFLTEYYTKHLDKLGSDWDIDIPKEKAQLFSMFIRDPRLGLGRRDLGRVLMAQSQVPLDLVVKAGRWDDIFHMYYDTTDINNNEWFITLDWIKTEILKGNELCKKWMPRYSSKNHNLAKLIATYWGMNKQQYGHFIKCNTVENQMSRQQWEDIKFEHVPSLAAIKYAVAFSKHQPERYNQYLEDVRAGKKELHVSTTNVYDIYRNRKNIDADVFFDKLEKISISCIPIVDSSGSMYDPNDSVGKAFAIGHYLAHCSTYCPNKVISFSSYPKLLTLEGNYQEQMNCMYTGDCSNTDFGKVMQLLSNLDGDMPEWLVVLSDMEFDMGSSTSKDATMKLFKEKGYNTKILWWNLNSRNITCPETDSYGNIFMSGYNPLLLKYLQVGFDGNRFLEVLLDEYKKNISIDR